MFSVGQQSHSTVIKIMRLEYRPNKNNDLAKFSSEKIDCPAQKPSGLRLGLERDKKFYTTNEFSIISADILSRDTIIIHIDRFNFITNECCMKGHPHLIDVIQEINLTKLEINLCEELVGFLGLVSTLDTSPSKMLTKERDEIISLQKEINKNDKAALEDQLLSLYSNHFLLENPRKCPHCILRYKKILKSFTFAVGQGNDLDSGLKLKLINSLNKESIVLHVPLLTGISDEQLFTQKTSIFSSKIIEHDLMKVSIFEEMENRKFDPNEQSPLYSVEHFNATTVPSLAVTALKMDLALYLIFFSKAKKDKKVFDIDKWDNRDDNFLGVNQYDKPAKRRRHKKSQHKMNKKNRDTALFYEEGRLNIQSVLFEASNSYEFVQIFSVIFSIISVQQLHSKYIQSLHSKKQKKGNENQAFYLIKSIRIKSNLKDLDFLLDIQNLTVRSLPIEKSSVLVPDSPALIDSLPDEINKAAQGFEEPLKLNEKIQTLKEALFISIDSVTLRISGFEFSLESPLIKVFSQVVQVKSPLNPYSQLTSNLIESSSANEISFKSLTLVRNSNNTPIIYLPYGEDIQEIDGFFCEISSKTADLQVVRKTTVSVHPVYFLVNGKDAVKLIAAFKSVIDELEESKVFSIFSIPDKYNFHNLVYLDISPVLTSITLHKIYSEFLLKKARISIFYLEDLSVQSSEHKNAYSGKASSIRLISNSEKYQEILSSSSEQPIDLKFTLSFTDNLFEFFLENTRLIYLTKIIEENIGFLNYVTKKNSKSSKAEPSSTSIKIILKNSAVFIPKSSKEDEFLLINFDTAEVQTFNDREMPWNIPIENQPIELSEKEVSLISSDREKPVQSTLVKISFSNIQSFHSQQSLGTVQKAELEVSIPSEPRTGEYLLKNKINLELIKADLTLSLPKLKLLDELITTNLDEPLENTEKIFKSKNTKLSVKISSGGLNISRFLTKPWENLKIVSLKADSKKDLRKPNQNFTIKSETEGDKNSGLEESESVLSDQLNPFDYAEEIRDESQITGDLDQIGDAFVETSKKSDSLSHGKSNFMT